MRDFVSWCEEQQLIDIAEDGTVSWKMNEDTAKKISHTEKFAGGRDGRKDLSSDYHDYCAHMGTVWPFKINGKKGAKAVAPVGK